MSKEFFCDLWCCNYRDQRNYQNCNNPQKDCPYRNLFFESENYKNFCHSMFKDWESEDDMWEKL